MKKFFFILSVTFPVLFVLSLGWIIVNIYMWSVHGIQSIIEETYLLENIYFSKFFLWILLSDITWIIFVIVFMFQRKNFKALSPSYYLQHNPIKNPKICVTMPTYNEEAVIEKVVNDFISQQNVNSVVVVDNKSTDNTVKIAEQCGAKVIQKEMNKGFSHSYVIGLKDALESDANVIVTTESDGTYNAHDIAKFLPYLDNCDMITGSRYNQILTEKGNQNSLLHVWGNLFLAKLIQIKFFTLKHMGILNLTDVGCGFIMFKKQALEKIIDKLEKLDTDNSTWNMSLRFYSILLALENDVRVIEVPVTFNKRIGVSKYAGKSFSQAIKIGFLFIWIILRY